MSAAVGLTVKRLRKMRAEAYETLHAPAFTEWFHPTQREVLALLDRVEEVGGLLARLSASGGRNIDLLARAEAAEQARDFHRRTSEARKNAAENAQRREAKWKARAGAAEAAVARVEALCQDTDGEWLDPEDECNNVGSILAAIRGDGA